MIEKYNGELDKVDPVALGVNLRTEDKSYCDREHDPTDNFYGADDEAEKFLHQFFKDIEKGWRREDRRLAKIKYLKQLPAFQQSLPKLGELVFIEFPSNKGRCFPCVVEYIPPERDKVLVRLTDGDASYGQSNLRLEGYDYPGEFIKLHREAPEGHKVGSER